MKAENDPTWSPEEVREEMSSPLRGWVRHKIVNGICYKVEQTEKSLGRCEVHNPPKKASKK